MQPDTPELPVRCEVVYATPERQVLLALTVPPGTTALGAVNLSSLGSDFPDADFNAPVLGVFSHRVNNDYVVKEGDRIEVYRALNADPKEVRRQLAAAGLTMSNRDEEFDGKNQN